METRATGRFAVRYSHIKPGTYQDSLRLMRLSRTLAGLDGVDELSVMMGTPANKEILRGAGLDTPDIDAAKPTDLVIAAEVRDTAVGDVLVAKVDEFLSGQASASSRSRLRSARSLERALNILGGADLALVSIPGEYVAAEAEQLLGRGIHVFVFSDNVDIEVEVALKRSALDHGLLVMGPDCGTGRICGLPLAFTNVVHDGSIGLVGASGTGLQEVMVQIDRLGGGVSHAIGVGGRDLSLEVGGIACLQALRALDADGRTNVIVLVGKPPAPTVRKELADVANQLSKPVVAVLLGELLETEANSNVHYARTLEEAARTAVELAGTRAARPVSLRPEQRWIKALYTGGTLAAEAAMLLAGPLGISEPGGLEAGYLLKSGGHEVIDLGDDVYTRGRPHPMIDASLRAERLSAVFDDPENAVLLLDVVLGYGSAADPAGALARAIVDGLTRVHADGRDLAVVASVCGTEDDPQALSSQVATLEQAGVTVLPNNAAAARHALAISQRRDRKTGSPPAPSEPIQRLLAAPPRVINIGLRDFAETLLAHGAQVVHYDWAPVAGGDRRLQALIAGLK